MRAGLTHADFPFLTRLGPEGRRELGALAASRAPRRVQLLRPGDDAGGAYLVVSGALRVYYVTPEGREATLYDVAPGGACVLSLSATLSSRPYPARVEAGPRGVAYVRVAPGAFRRLVDEEPAFRDYVLGALSSRIFELMRTLEELGSERIEQRVARHLLRRRDADGEVRATQAAIARDLGTAREVVSRALRSLAKRGLVRGGRMRVQLLDEPALRALASPT